MLELIKPTDTLAEGYPKINAAIQKADQAFVVADNAVDTANNALAVANQSLANSQSVQEQLNQVVINGDSSVEAAQARVNADNTKTYATLKERLDSEYVELKSQFEENTKQIVNIGDKKWGVKADGVTDDTDAFESALQYATDNGCKVVLPKGVIKITRPITILYYEKDGETLSVPRYSFVIEGLGGTSAGILKEYGSEIKAYNIPDKRGAIELLGLNNGLTNSVELKNLQITLDKQSCDELSFCLKIGDSWMFTLKKVKLRGYNCVLLRCGTADGANTYANIGCKFDQTYFQTERYVGWDGETLDQKARFGFAVANERMFYDNGLTPYRSDNITFDTCFIGGSLFNYIVSSVYTNCMFYTPGGYKPEIDITSDTRFNRAFLDVSTIDCSVGIWNAGGCATLINPYFEDVRKCVFIRSLFGQDNETIILNPFFLGTLNVVPVIGGVNQSCVYAIKSETVTGYNSSIRVIDGTYIKGNTGFSEGVIVNKGAKELIVQHIANVKPEDIIDSGSRNRDIKYRFLHFENELTLEWEGKANAAPLVLSGSDFKNYTFEHDYILTKIELITDNILTEAHSLNFNVNNATHMNIQGFGTNRTTSDYIDYEVGTLSERYIIKNFPTTINSIVPDWGYYRKFHFKKGDVLDVLMGITTSPSADQDTKVKVKLYFKS